MAKTGAPWNVTVQGGISVIEADDDVRSRLEIPPVASPERMGQLLRGHLGQRGFRDADDGSGNIVRERNGVRVTLNPETGDMTAEAGGHIEVPKDPPHTGCGCRMQAALEEANRRRRKAEVDLQVEVTGRLERALPAIACELEGAVNVATKQAIVEKARSMGEIKVLEEGQDGSLTVVVEV